jgi:hypothetical protein
MATDAYIHTLQQPRPAVNWCASEPDRGEVVRRVSVSLATDRRMCLTISELEGRDVLSTSRRIAYSRQDGCQVVS